MLRRAILACLASLTACAAPEPEATGAPIPLVRPNPVPAAQACAPRPRVVEHLSRGFAEAPAAIGLTDEGALLEIFASEDGATWTALVSLPNGISRLVITGRHWTLHSIGRGS